MALVVSLRDMVGEMQMLSSETHIYLNKLTGEFITISDNEISESEDNSNELPDWQQESLQDAQRVSLSDDYLELPSQFEIHDYAIMERFCDSIENSETKDTLSRKIRGSGAFRRFKESIYRNGIENDWFQFRDRAYKKIAITWLEENDISFQDDIALS